MYRPTDTHALIIIDRFVSFFYFKAWTCCPTEKTVYFKFTEINKQINTSH